MFKREVVTVPAAGTFKPISRSARIVVVESMPAYAGPDARPGLYFDSKSGERQPLYNQWTYSSIDGFGKLWLEGTAESAGDQIYLLLSDSCADDQINPNTEQLTKAIAGQTISEVSTNNAKALNILQLAKDDLKPSSVYISARNNAINYGFVDGGASPDQSDSWFYLAPEDPPIEIQGIDFIEKLQYASAAVDTPGELVISPEY